MKFEEYKEHLQQSNFSEWKEQVAKIVFQKNLSSVMNDTKWIELQKSIADLSFPPPFILKCVTDESDFQTALLHDAPHYYGDWSSYWEEGLPPFFAIQWIKVNPKYGKYRGRLVADEILDETEEFIAILEKFSIHYEYENGIITIYGYI